MGEVAEWSKAADCKSAGVSLRRFESCPPQKYAGVAQLARASAFQAEGRGFESRLPLSERPRKSGPSLYSSTRVLLAFVLGATEVLPGSAFFCSSSGS